MTTFADFEIVSELARGGQGSVYRAVHAPTGRTVALKMLTDSRPEALKRFRQEARVLARLRHPNVLQVIDHGDHQGTPYLATELVEGTDLDASVEAHGVPIPKEAARLVAAVAQALEYCHGRGVVHRDVKPANVVLEQGSGRTVLIDFGLVKRDINQMHLASLDASVMSADAKVKGTPAFMAPEQVNPREFGEVGPRTDVYGLGALLYYLLTGQVPFDGRAMVIVMRKVTRKLPVDPRVLRPHLPDALAVLCMQSLAKEQGDRPGSAAEFAVALCRAAGLPPPSAQPDDPTLDRSEALPSGGDGPLPGDAALPSSGSGRLALTFPARLPMPGQVFAGCRVEAEIGRGGAGAVYVALRPDGSRCAIKVVLGDMTDEYRKQRFLREAQVGKELQHPGIVQVLGRGYDGNLAYLIMELVQDGLPLDRYVREKQLSIPQRVQLILQVAQALEVAHADELIHRDLKPDNVLVTPEGQVKVLDFGLALHQDKERLTLSGAILGTISYMAPEQVMGQAHESTARTDVWAMGVMLYELVKGELPFTGATNIEVMAGIIEDDPEDPCLGVEGASQELSAVIRVALAKASEHRYPNAAAFGRDLVAASSGSGHVSAVIQLRASNRKRTAVQLLLAIVVLALVVFGLTYGVVQSRKLGESEVRQRLGSLLGETRKLFATEGLPLAERGTQARRLSEELDAVVAGAKEDVGTGRVEKLRTRLTTVAGLSALAAGDVKGAEIAYEQVRGSSSYEVGALAGGLGAFGNGTRDEAIKQLSRALQRGLTFPELITWRLRLRAQGARALPSSVAEEVLGDLSVVEGTRTLSEAEGALRGAAQLALGRFAEAEATLATLSSPPASLRWGVALVLASQELDKAPANSLARLAGLPDPVPKTQASVSLARQAQDLLGTGLGTSGKLLKDTYRGLLPVLRLVARLQPAEPIPDPLRDALLHATDSLMAGQVSSAMEDFAVALAEAYPKDLSVQRHVARLANWVHTSARKTRLFPALRRAVDLAEVRSEKLEAWVKLCVQLAWVGEHREDAELCEEAIALSTRLLDEVHDPRDRAFAFLARGSAYRGAKELESALRDFDEGLECKAAPELFYMRAKTLWELKRDPKKNFGDACDFLLLENVSSSYVRSMLAIAWELYPKHDDQERMSEVITHYLVTNPSKWKFWARLSLLRLQLGEPDAAKACLESAIEQLGDQDAAVSAHMKTLRGRLEAGDTGAAAALKKWVTEL